MASVKIKVGSIWVEVEGGVKDVFKTCTEFAILQESQCGACQSTNICPEHRVAQGYDFYSFRCGDCNAELKLGQKRDAETLFPKRKNEQGERLPNRGWEKWQGGTQSQQPSRQDEEPDF